MDDKERMKERGYALKQICEAWKETCEHFGFEYNENDLKITFKEKKKDE